MNIAITQGLALNPPAFSGGLNVWSRETGRPGTALWSTAGNAAIVPSDQDFGNALEIIKTADVERIRYMGETPIQPGTFLRISARIKAVVGNLPSVRIAAFGGNAARQPVAGIPATGPAMQLSAYGDIVEVSAIVATGDLPGVDMAWGTEAVMGHFGLDLFGANGGVVRIESVEIDDVTTSFLSGRLDWVDVRDFGAVGDGATDCHSAFRAAARAAGGGGILVPDGIFKIGSSLSVPCPIRFEGRLTMPRSAKLTLLRNFDFPSYADAFGDETEGLKRGLQTLFGYCDHSTFDLCGRRVDLTEPLNIAELAPGLTTWSARRVLSNGQIQLIAGPAWTTGQASSSGRYNPGRPFELTSVAGVAGIEVGSLVTGQGVGREVYVKSRDVAGKKLTLSQPLYGGAGTRTYSFKRFRYALDFSGVGHFDRFIMSDVQLILAGIGSGLMLSPSGEMTHIRDCFFNKPKDRGVTSIGRACQDLLIDRCQFLSNESPLLAQDRRSVCFNVNANDSKIRDNRFVHFGLTMIVAGTGHLIESNHWFQGDSAAQGVRVPGLVLSGTNKFTTINGNYIDNCFVEWTTEHDAAPDFGAEFSFGGLSMSSNICYCHNVASTFSWLVIKPYGSGHFIHGLSVTDNVFRVRGAAIDRVDRVDDSIAGLDANRMRNVSFSGNTYNGVVESTANPLILKHNQASAQSKWVIPTQNRLPFGGWVKTVESVTATSIIKLATGSRVKEMPVGLVERGTRRDQLHLKWSQPAKGTVTVRVRMDEPT